MKPAPKSACKGCMEARKAQLEKLGLRLDHWDHVVALAGNPNVGKSTIFNALTGLRQHTGNWPGKTMTRAEGGFTYEGRAFKLVDLPGTYSLLSTSQDEQVARNFILFGKPDVTVVVVDATRLERNLNLVLQVLQITDHAVVALNLIDEAKAFGLTIDARGLARDLGVPVVPTAARAGEGIGSLLRMIDDVATGRFTCRPHRPQFDIEGFREAHAELTAKVARAYPDLSQPQWIALRLLEGDESLRRAVESGDLSTLNDDHAADVLQPVEVSS